jgi:hypothetical protein
MVIQECHDPGIPFPAFHHQQALFMVHPHPFPAVLFQYRMVFFQPDQVFVIVQHRLLFFVT